VETALLAPDNPLAQVRAMLHRAVEETDDLAVLEALVALLHATQAAAPPAPEAARLADLPPAERAAVEEGLRDAQAGRVRPHADVWAELQAEFGQKTA